jgi:hypothetical protein
MSVENLGFFGGDRGVLISNDIFLLILKKTDPATIDCADRVCRIWRRAIADHRDVLIGAFKLEQFNWLKVIGPNIWEKYLDLSKLDIDRTAPVVKNGEILSDAWKLAKKVDVEGPEKVTVLTILGKTTLAKLIQGFSETPADDQIKTVFDDLVSVEAQMNSLQGNAPMAASVIIASNGPLRHASGPDCLVYNQILHAKDVIPFVSSEKMASSTFKAVELFALCGLFYLSSGRCLYPTGLVLKEVYHINLPSGAPAIRVATLSSNLIKESSPPKVILRMGVGPDLNTLLEVGICLRKMDHPEELDARVSAQIANLKAASASAWKKKWGVRTGSTH